MKVKKGTIEKGLDLTKKSISSQTSYRGKAYRPSFKYETKYKKTLKSLCKKIRSIL